MLLRTKEPSGLTSQEEAAFAALVKAAFAHRRKTFVNSLRDEGYDPRRATAALELLDLSPVARAETLSVGQFVQLSRLVTTPIGKH
jgi:16S rRNA (adenine1518-N6/adenine1519-N6)-dimethyltransferase